MASEELNTLYLALLLNALQDDDPELAYRLYRRVRERLQGTEQLDPLIADVFERHLEYPFARFRRRAEETRQIAISTVEGFREAFEANISERTQRQDQLIQALSNRLDIVEEEMGEHYAEFVIDADMKIAHDWLWQIGVDPEVSSFVRYIPVRIYLPERPESEAQIETLLGSVTALADSAGLEKTLELPEDFGSWWKRLWFKTRNAATHPEVQDALSKTRDALEATYLDKPQAEANKAQAEAASSLLISLKDIPNACIQAGTLLIVKRTDGNGTPSVIARTLTKDELRRLEQHQSILQKPQEIINWLDDGRAQRRLPKRA